MLSSQADELRKAALIQGAHARYDVASLLTDAADTILSLRDRAQELQAENARLQEVVADGEMHASEILAENAKLREDNACLVKAIEELHSVKLEDRLVALENENDRLREQLQEAEHEESVAWDRVRKAERESDRLRAARDMWQENDAKLRELVSDMCERAYIDSTCDLQEQFADRLRELGIEVNA